MREERTEVLIVGAGPVGLWTALLLARAGIEVAVIDREERTAARSYACALHPRTLGLLQQVNVAQTVLAQSRAVRTIAFYDGENRRAEVHLAGDEGHFPFLAILPQNQLETTLEEALRAAGVKVYWNHRFDELSDEQREVIATIEELGGTGTGYIVPHWETTVRRRTSVGAQFLVGADGHHSLVRDRLAIGSDSAGERESFAAYEFECDETSQDEMRVVLDDRSTNVLWPLPGNRFRWTFQMLKSDAPAEFPEKERSTMRLAQPQIDERIRAYVQKVAKNRAPWFAGEVKRIAWCTEVGFEPSLARSFGKGRCWLAGDAAHQTGPVGVQSMNLGFAEGKHLAEALVRALRGSGPNESLAAYDRQQQNECRKLLGLNGGLQPRADADAWVRRRCARILPCLPATGGDLTGLANQLRLDMPWGSAPLRSAAFSPKGQAGESNTSPASGRPT